MKILNCRNCGNRKIEKLFSLGDLCYSGFFPKKKTTNVQRKNLTLVKCKSCHLVQLNEKFNPKKLYNMSYGYRTGINKTMTNHVKQIVKETSKLVKLKKNNFVLDIATNDATLLNFYPKNVYKCGCDPILKKFENFYKKIDYKISDFFSYNKVKNIVGAEAKFKIITAIAVFYDLEDPNKFLKDVHKLLSDDGVFILEIADLYKIIKNNMFDTICHEHTEYYSCEVIFNMALNNDLRVFDIKNNISNGGSARFFICKNKSIYKSNINHIKKILNKENIIGLKSLRIYKIFYERINIIKKKLVNKLNKLKFDNNKIFGYGASTKGNILMDYFGITNKLIDYIADRNPEKNGAFTPFSKIPIISEKAAQKLNPDYYLVLPWHFKKEILIREKRQIEKGTKYIFPLPKISIY